MKTLTLDIATHVGFAIVEDGIFTESGGVELASKAELSLQRKNGGERTLDLRFTRFRQFVESKVAKGVTRIVFEDVTFAKGSMQPQLWGSLRAGIWTAAHTSSVEVFCIHTGSLKAFATGDGGADKAAMATALALVDPINCLVSGSTLLFHGHPADHDEVDAIWLARFALAVDRGEQRFLSAYQRGGLLDEEKQRKRLAIKVARKARKKAKVDEAKVRRRRKAKEEVISEKGACVE